MFVQGFLGRLVRLWRWACRRGLSRGSVDLRPILDVVFGRGDGRTGEPSPETTSQPLSLGTSSTTVASGSPTEKLVAGRARFSPGLLGKVARQSAGLASQDTAGQSGPPDPAGEQSKGPDASEPYERQSCFIAGPFPFVARVCPALSLPSYLAASQVFSMQP